MSQYPRRVLTDTAVAWDPHANGAGRVTFARHGTVVDVVPGSALEAAYGLASLSGVIPVSQRGDGTTMSRAAQANLWARTRGSSPPMSSSPGITRRSDWDAARSSTSPPGPRSRTPSGPNG